MKSIVTSLILFLSLAAGSQATVSISFNNSTQKLTNLANAAGTPSSGMNWGIVVSTANSSFAGGGTGYDAFDFNAMPVLNAGAVSTGRGIFLSVGGILTDDFFYTTGFTTTNPGGTDGGIGSPTGTLQVLSGDAPTPDLGANNMTNNDPFGLLWLSAPADASVGAKYGFLTNPAFVLPANSGFLNLGSVFDGADPIRSASNTFQGIPEPSRAILAGFGLLGFLMRRRRA